ncbi:MAG: class I SAM-dependent methyltransferase [Deltaproteobacteria bacterium]|nr:class I SAM-dependent methyltransferase [Deltaproteobacteria bacterium]
MNRKPVSPSLYTKEYYQKYNHGYEVSKKNLDMLPELKNFLKEYITKGDNVLDVGCGRGESIYLCHKIGARCVGIDYSKDAVAIARANLSRVLTNRNIKITVADAKKLPFKKGMFNVVIMMDIVEHQFYGIDKLTPRVHSQHLERYHL